MPIRLPLTTALPADRLARLEGWGMSSSSMAWVYRPGSIDDIELAFKSAQRSGHSIGLRGGGNSYGDAALNAENVVLDLTRMDRILAWDPGTGVVDAEGGVTIEQLWRHCLEDGWWPPVVSGTMYPTLGGALGMNIHGKNNFAVGPIGDHVSEIDVLTPSGELITCSLESAPELFRAVIGGAGLLGCITRVRMQMKRVSSGLVEVAPSRSSCLAEMEAVFGDRHHDADYLVGWVDGFATGPATGRGQIHEARYLALEEDPAPARSLAPRSQDLPDTIMGRVPKSLTWRLMKPFVNRSGTRFVNAAKYTMSGLPLPSNQPYRQGLVGFSFLLDYVPNWKWSYRPDGLIQYQSFIPADVATEAQTEILHLSQRRDMPPYLAVYKRHRPDAFLLTHAVDGYSLALDYRVHDRGALWALCRDLDRIVLDAGGRFYFAKDSTLRPEIARAYLGDETLARFFSLKRAVDPGTLLQTDLWRRVLAPLARAFH